MVTAQNILYSKSAIARIENVDVSDVIRLEVWHSVVFVIIRGRRPRFYSKQQFKKHFVARRQAAARALVATQNIFNPNVFYVRNETKGTAYTVNFFTNGANCECDDFDNQKRFFGKACCKHIYAALNQIGHSSLRTYIEERRAIARAIVESPPAA
ncbi:hypothetical protein C7B80_33090 [Cyanosarcina cf. burmensis CCALA 770]|nr:hypothetical protein C7B80_33090 [Cyanosarcina cf. burmensis CCALA 770]